MNQHSGGYKYLALPIGTIILGALLLIQSFGWLSSDWNWIAGAVTILVGVIFFVVAIARRRSGLRPFAGPIGLLIVGILLLLVGLDVFSGAWIQPLVILILGVVMLRN